MTNSHHSSEDNEHYTPPDYVEAARALMGSIDLDPASNALANQSVKAATYYSRSTNGFDKEWSGNVWLNPPGGIGDNQGRLVLNARKGKKPRQSCRVTGECGVPAPHEHANPTSMAKAWWFKLAAEYRKARVDAAVFMGFNLELLQTTQTPCFNSRHGSSIHDFPLCFPSKRVKFFTPDDDGVLQEGGQPTHANVLVYLPKLWNEIEQMRFEALFSDFGRCIWPATSAAMDTRLAA